MKRYGEAQRGYMELLSENPDDWFFLQQVVSLQFNIASLPAHACEEEKKKEDDESEAMSFSQHMDVCRNFLKVLQKKAEENSSGIM